MNSFLTCLHTSAKRSTVLSDGVQKTCTDPTLPFCSLPEAPLDRGMSQSHVLAIAHSKELLSITLCILQAKAFLNQAVSREAD